ncbi:Protein kinase domain [Macleaya cordata]|uniref:Protein kinase domain n=1 Tax=Macleaya cordata TaxID=56857 RepID=A0A200QZL0_MACCD|nr:Protein kinase domain [Macleaya cordata]
MFTLLDFSSITFFLLSLSTVSAAADTAVNHPQSSIHQVKLLPSDALAILAFKSTADLQNNLRFSVNNKTFNHCQWVGVKCAQGRVVRIVLEGFHLGGIFRPNTLTRLDQLRVLSLQNNSLTGPIPDLSGLVNLKSLFLDHNSFSGYFPPSILSLHRLRTLDLSYNNLTGSIPPKLTDLDRLYYLRLEWNHFDGLVPPLNQSSLQIFNVSGNNLTGAVPVTVTLSHFHFSSFSWNPGLCGEILHKDCHSGLPFFGSSSVAPSPAEIEQSQQLTGLILPPPSSQKEHKKPVLILGFSAAVLVLIGSLLGFFMAIKRRRKQRVSISTPPTLASDSVAAAAAVVMRVEEENELEAKVKQMQKIQLGKSGCLMFCAGEAQVYSLEQLMRASAEMLGRGSIGTTYKAVLDNQLIVSVKRLDAVKTAKTSKEMFESHMQSVGVLRHPNLVPLRAYFQAKEEKLLIYDYQPNGSLFSLIHGSRSTRSKPLHWTSCLKIAEDVAQGLAYIHQASRLLHGNLKSSNVLLGTDFEACLTDYCLTTLADSVDDPDSAGYRAPEIRNSGSPATTKSDVYAFGILLLELLTGKPASNLFHLPTDLQNWVGSEREFEGGDENRLWMLLELATGCSKTSPEQRPTMWQVMKMIQEIKETVVREDNELMNSSKRFS